MDIITFIYYNPLGLCLCCSWSRGCAGFASAEHCHRHVVPPSSPFSDGKGREKSPEFFTTDCKGQLFNGILGRGSPKKLGCSESGPWGCTEWVTGRGIKNLWVIIPNTTDQICSELFSCSYVLSNVQRSSESPFSDLSPMKNATHVPLLASMTCPKPGVPLHPRQLSRALPPQNPPNSSGSRMGSGTCPAEGTCQGRTMCQHLFVPLQLCHHWQQGHNLEVPHPAMGTCSLKSQSDLWKGFSVVAATQHLQLSDENTLKWNELAAISLEIFLQPTWV